MLTPQARTSALRHALHYSSPDGLPSSLARRCICRKLLVLACTVTNGPARASSATDGEPRLPIFPLIAERRDIAALLADEEAFRAQVVAGPAANPYARRNSREQERRVPALTYQITRAGTSNSAEPPPLNLGSLSVGYF